MSNPFAEAAEAQKPIDAPASVPVVLTASEAGLGKTAIITGCASGIGLATTQLFLNHQYQVFGVDISDMDLDKIDAKHQERFHFHKADLRKEMQCEGAVESCVARYGEKIDVLANVAGVMDGFESADTISDDAWDRVIAINLTVPTKLMRGVLPFMKSNKSGSIVNVASRAAYSGATAGLAYTASKHGLLGVTKQTAWRFREDGIRCNAVLPGGVETNIASSINMATFDQDALAHAMPVISLQQIPGKCYSVQAVDIANSILFLASDQAYSINGVGLPIDQAWGVI